ncbi:uncharacterized protein N7511_009405 [Penicillium nucicola]|uniref:uncharacterized protein n=1 Tax=Penicillium nucicola TaxID=1850975 RepID=UPI00254569FC|nr:uncharacterized protein N7511_009405 [Penicillium nucicola]KAJ5747709.1 hypothetical protein N7511_009405 [Penicillium nucicola]
MSARGYDSDAQCIGTPQHLSPLNASPINPTFRRMGLNDIIERSREREDSELWAENGVQTHANGREPPFGMHFVPTPPGSLRGRPRVTRAKPATATSSQSVPSLGDSRSGQQNSFTKSLPSLHPSQEIVPGQEHLRARDGVVGSSAENLQGLGADWLQYMGGSPQGYRTASSGSIYNPSQDLSVSKTRPQPSSHRTDHEPRVPCLGDMGISQRLAGTALGSGQTSANTSASDVTHQNKYGSFMASQENVASSSKSEASTIVGLEAQKQAMLHKRDVSSFYSRQSSNPSGEASPAAQSLRARPTNLRGIPVFYQDMLDKTHVNKPYPRKESPKGKFGEHFRDSNMISVQDQSTPSEIAGQRKVSPGWMTGGRRMGYGYSMVDNAEGEPRQVDGAGSPLPHGGWRNQTPEPTPGNIQMREMNASIQYQTGMTQSPGSGPPEQGPSGSPSDNRRFFTPRSPDKALDEFISTPERWARIQGRSAQAYNSAPLPADLAADKMTVANPLGPIPIRDQQKEDFFRKGVDYVEDSETFLGRWTKNSRGKEIVPRPLKINKGNSFKSEQRRSSQELPPPVQHRFSMDQTNRPQSVYFDSRDDGGTDQVEETPTRSRSGRWILRFSRNRESKRRSNLPPKEPSQNSSMEYDDSGRQELGRTNSTRSDMAEELASAYQECIAMPGAFYGSKWASRTSLVVEAE